MTMTLRISDEDLDAFQSEFSGAVLRPDSRGYDAARSLHNGLIDKRPGLIVRCRGTADIVAALAFARRHEAEVSVRGGGHNVAGRALTEGGLMIDLSEMRGIHVDPTARTIRAQGGVTWAEFNREAALHGLASTGGAVSSTGIAGLTLGGGLGWLMGKHGLAADNLRSVELVTADGTVLDVTADSHPDLFWALRGGGGNFGVAASLEYRLHPQPGVYAGLLVHPKDQMRAGLEFYREFTASAPDDLTVFAILGVMPDEPDPSLIFMFCHAGEPEQAEADTLPLRSFGSPTFAQVDRMPYPVLNTMLDGGANAWGLRNYWKSGFVDQLGDELLADFVQAATEAPSDLNGLALEHFHGAVSRIPVDATAVPHRGPGYNVMVTATWEHAADDDSNIAWAREAFARLARFMNRGRWINYLSDDETSERISAAYGANLARLREVKRRYDPDNLFRLNHNILPD